MKKIESFLLPFALMTMLMPKVYAQTSSPSWHEENLAQFLDFVQDESTVLPKWNDGYLYNY